MEKPIIAITLGDVAGIGPEIVVKSLFHPKVYEVCRPVVIGNKDVLKNTLFLYDKTTKVNVIKKPWQGEYQRGTIDLIDMQNIDVSKLKMCTVQAICGRAAYDYIEKAIKLALVGEVDAIATAPINKKSLHAAQMDYIGHTEILAAITKTEDPMTMLEVRGIRIFSLSRHVSLRQACDLITQERVFDYIIRCSETLKKLGVTEGTLAVAGLNPHSGENGLLGDEETKYIGPAIQEAQARGYQVVGPIGADSVFYKTLQGHYNAVLSLYHDQGHIAAKTLDFERTVSITSGLPFLRTSVDHGTAFDIAGRGIATEVGMTESILVAAKYAPLFKKQS